MLGGSFLGLFSYYPYITPFTGPVLPTLALAVTGVTALMNFATQQSVSSLRLNNEGELEVKYNVTPFITKTATANLGAVHSFNKESPFGQILILSSYTQDGQKVNE